MSGSPCSSYSVARFPDCFQLPEAVTTSACQYIQDRNRTAEALYPYPQNYQYQHYIVMISTLYCLPRYIFLLSAGNGQYARRLPFRGQLANAFLGAVTPRTAGFCVADMGTLTTGTLMLTLILMIIGAAPMSTGGGLKVTTVCVALLTAHNAARGKRMWKSANVKYHRKPYAGLSPQSFSISAGWGRPSGYCPLPKKTYRSSP